MIRKFEAPSERDASTNSFSRRDSTCPRMIRAGYVQLVSVITAMTTGTPGLISPPMQPLPNEHAEARPMASSRYGMASQASTTRETSVSTQPR